jgi:hypothetical protein
MIEVIGAVFGKALAAEWFHRRQKRKLLRGSLGGGSGQDAPKVGPLK